MELVIFVLAFGLCFFGMFAYEALKAGRGV